MYSLYAASKVYVEKLSQGLQAEYKDKGVIIQVHWSFLSIQHRSIKWSKKSGITVDTCSFFQAVSPFGVSTKMSAYSKNPATLEPEYFVKCSLQYVTAGDKTYGSFRHALMVGLTATIWFWQLETSNRMMYVCVCLSRVGYCRIFQRRFSMRILRCMVCKNMSRRK